MASFTTPFIEGVTIWQSPAITRNAVAYQEPAFVKSVSIAEAELGNDTSCNVEVELDNAPGTYHGYPSVSLREGALCRATVGSKLSDGGVQYLTASGLVLTEIDPSPTRTILRFADILGALELAVWDRGDINLRGWSPADAIMCVGNLYGIPEDRFDLEDLGEYLIGDWKWEGQTIRSIMSDIAKRGGRGASLWFDPIDFKIKTGCRYCRAKRTAGDFASHQDNGWNSSGCLAADEDRVPGGVDGTLRVDTSRDRASLFFAEQFSGRGSRLTGEFLDRVQVQGKGFDGYPVRLQAQDARSISGQNADGTDVSAEDFAERYIGWRKSKVVDIQDDLQRGIRSTAKLGESTWDLLGQSLIEEMDAFGQRGRQIPGVVTPLAPTMRVGYVVYVIGGEWSEADEKKFRVRGAKHEATGHSTFNLQEMIGRLD